MRYAGLGKSGDGGDGISPLTLRPMEVVCERAKPSGLDMTMKGENEQIRIKFPLAHDFIPVNIHGFETARNIFRSWPIEKQLARAVDNEHVSENDPRHRGYA